MASRNSSFSVVRSTGDSYVGTFKGGWDKKYHGQGTSTWADGSKYIGEWKNNKRDGQGTYTWPSGSKYIGEWLENERHGDGAYVWSSGHTYVGQWMSDVRHGFSTTTYADGFVENGFWYFGNSTSLAGPVCLGNYSAFSWHNCIGSRPSDSNNFYLGWYQNGLANGEGHSFNGIKKKRWYYHGNFKDGKKHGLGTAKFAGGAIGEFKNDRRNGKGAYFR